MLAILAAMMLAAAPQHDTVFTAEGGRVVGTVVEDGPHGIAVQLADGTFRHFARRDVVRIEYADGSVSKPGGTASPPAAAAPAPAPAPRYAPPPAYAPPPPPQAYPPPPPAYYPPPYVVRRPPPPWAEPHPTGPISPLYLAFGLGGSFMSGEAEQGVDVRNKFGPQLNLAFEGGARLTPHFALALYGDVGYGDPGRNVRNQCSTSGIDCAAQTARVGVLLRHTFRPAARSTPWLSIGTGYESGKVWTDAFGGTTDVFNYTGWEVLRLMAGVDLRSNPVFGVGFYGGVRLGKYTHFDDAAISEHLPGDPFHTTIEGGIRFTLFP